MTENEITLFNKNIDLCIKKLKETRIFIQNLDTIYMNNHNFKSKKDIPENCDYYEQRKTLNITMLCYAINLDITIIQNLFCVCFLLLFLIKPRKFRKAIDNSW